MFGVQRARPQKLEMSMDSRERVFTALGHGEPDRVPRDFWATRGAWGVIRSASGMSEEEWLDAGDFDFRYIRGPEYIGPPLPADTDIWGVKRRVVSVKTAYGEESYSEVAGSPLAWVESAEEVEEYGRWPSADDFDYSVVRAQSREVRGMKRVVVFMGDRLNRIAQLKPAMYLRGVERIFMDLALNPPVAAAIFGRLRSFYVAYLARILEAADGLIDIVLTGDDYGQQNGPLISPAMWDEYLAEGFGAYMDVIHAYGARSMHHTCGDVRLFAARMGKLGLDILQSLQPEAMRDWFGELKAKYGGGMSFHGGVSIQQTLPHGSPADVAAEVRERVESLASGGGYILCTAHNIQADCPPENITALLDAYRKYGSYA